MHYNSHAWNWYVHDLFSIFITLRQDFTVMVMEKVMVVSWFGPQCCGCTDYSHNVCGCSRVCQSLHRFWLKCIIISELSPSPFPASANICNVGLMRHNELSEGIDVLDNNGNVVGSSRIAARHVRALSFLHAWFSFEIQTPSDFMKNK